jgi:hypothetical protein
MLRGTTYRTPTPLGTAYITINHNGDADPFEVFANVGKAGSDTAAVAEAIGRLVSLALRMPSPLSAHERLTEVIDQLSGIGGPRPMGFGPNRVPLRCYRPDSGPTHRIPRSRAAARTIAPADHHPQLKSRPVPGLWAGVIGRHGGLPQVPRLRF